MACGGAAWLFLLQGGFWREGMQGSEIEGPRAALCSFQCLQMILVFFH